MALLYPSITCLILSVQVQLNFKLFLLHIFFNLWPSGKHVLIRLMNTLPMFVCTFLLNGGLNQIMFLHLLPWFDGLCGAGFKLQVCSAAPHSQCILVRKFSTAICWLLLGYFLCWAGGLICSAHREGLLLHRKLTRGRKITSTSYPKFDLVILCKLAKNKEGGQSDLKKTQSN